MGTALKLVIKETKFRMPVCIKQNGSLENDLSKVPWSITNVGTLNTFYSPNKMYQYVTISTLRVKDILAAYKSGYDYNYIYLNVLQMFTITWNLGLASTMINHLEWHHE